MRAAWISAVMAIGIATAATIMTGTASAEVTSGYQVGESVGAMTVTKVTGNALDGIPDTRALHRCRNRPACPTRGCVSLGCGAGTRNA